MSRPTLPDDSEHIAIAGRTGSGKTVAALNMLVRRDYKNMAWIVVDHKHDDNVKKLGLEEINVNTLILPKTGIYVVRPKFDIDGKNDLEALLERIFKRGKTGVYIDEGHLLGHSDAIRMMMVAGRSKRVPVMWCSQRASWIDSFIWSQASYYRVFALQTQPDIKKFNENFPIKFSTLPQYHSYYYDVKQGEVYLLAPADQLSASKGMLDAESKKWYSKI